jgi:hypothetical protein
VFSGCGGTHLGRVLFIRSKEQIIEYVIAQVRECVTRTDQEVRLSFLFQDYYIVGTGSFHSSWPEVPNCPSRPTMFNNELMGEWEVYF